MARTLTDTELAKWCIVLGVFGAEFDDSFIRKVTETEKPTEKQLMGLNKCVVGLRMSDKLKRFRLDGFTPYFEDDVDWDDESNEMCKCFVTDERVADTMCIFDTAEKRFMSVEAFKSMPKPKTKSVKKKVKASDLC
jgi:hypothetical protein